MRGSRFSAGAMATLLAVMLSGCGASQPADTGTASSTGSAASPTASSGGGTTVSPSPSTTSTPPAHTASSASPSVGGPSRWTSGATVVTRALSVPPVPRCTGIRAATHSAEGFDRIVFDIDGGLPGYEIRYVSRVVADPSGRLVSMPGRRYLQVILRPAQGHDEHGAKTVSGRHDLGFPMLKGYVVTGDVEGVLTITLGLDDVVGYRVGELPGRIYVDVAA